MQREVVLLVEEDGTVRGLASDLFPWQHFGGTPQVRRASEVEWEGGKWVVRMGGVPVFAHEQRDICIQWEVQELQGQLARGVRL